MKCPNTKMSCPESNDPETGCPWWIVLTYNDIQIGRCAVVWIPTLLIENRVAIDKLNPDMKKPLEIFKNDN